MKTFTKFFAGLLMTGLVLFSNTTSQAVPAPGPENAYIGRAHTVVGTCLAGYQAGPGGHIESEVNTYICFFTGAVHVVNFYYVGGPPCNPGHEPCPRPFVKLIATVEFGCDDALTSYACY